MNLLVVEDNPRDMQELLNLLHGWEEQNQPLGIRAESCITADTMQAFQGYDAVLLDIETPGIDGMAFARRLRACNSRIDIIFVTCHTDLVVMDGFGPRGGLSAQAGGAKAAVGDTGLPGKALHQPPGGRLCDLQAARPATAITTTISFISRPGSTTLWVVTPQTRQNTTSSLTQALENLPQLPPCALPPQLYRKHHQGHGRGKRRIIAGGGVVKRPRPPHTAPPYNAPLALKA